MFGDLCRWGDWITCEESTARSQSAFSACYVSKCEVSASQDVSFQRLVPFSTRNMAKSGQISSHTPHPTHEAESFTRGGLTPRALSLAPCSRTSLGQNSMQKEQPLHLSSRTTISTSLSFRPWGADIGRRPGLTGEAGCSVISAVGLHSCVTDSCGGLLEINVSLPI